MSREDRSPVEDRSPIEDDRSPIETDPTAVEQIERLERQIVSKDAAIRTIRAAKVIAASDFVALRREIAKIRIELSLAVDAQDWDAVLVVIAKLNL